MHLLWATTDIRVRQEEAVKWKAAQLSPEVKVLPSIKRNESGFIAVMFSVNSKTRCSVLFREWGNITFCEISQFNFSVNSMIL